MERIKAPRDNVINLIGKLLMNMFPPKVWLDASGKEIFKLHTRRAFRSTK